MIVLIRGGNMIILIIICIILIYQLYAYLYFKSEDFVEIRDSIEINAKNCNELNQHIEKLKNAYIDIKQIDYGQADYVDNSRYNYRRPELKRLRNQKNVYNCSLSVCRNAQQQPFKYICKYFNIKTNEETLAIFENVLNDFSAAEQGKELLKNVRDQIVANLSSKIPQIIQIFSKKRLIRNLGFDDIDFSQLYFPRYIFQYVSAGGNSSMDCEVTLNIENLDRFVKYLSELVKFKKSVAGQRALMTSSLREKIKRRDNYTCRNCGLSIEQEPNLLLEIDHIIPLSKNGITSEDNLQTLCWKCNRKKGSKIMEKKENV
jgi:hypothetical protein